MTSARTGTRLAAERPPARRAPAKKAPARKAPAKRPPAKRTAARPPAATPQGGNPWVWRHWWPALLIGVVVLVSVVWKGDRPAEVTPTALCTVPSTSVTLSGEQWTNAQTIAAVGKERGLPERAIVIALATAMQESTLRNLDYGDRDSLGLFQQRPSQGWGTPAQVQDPVYAAGQFYDRLVRVPGWDTMRLTEAAQLVQRSGFPELYQQHEPLAAALTAALRTDDRTRNCG
ncbi:hypothetical protein [Geodermatophilus nigrescens]|uniref:Peptidase M23 n=1 Tax=Geodermatophilus nigrescens TaxID=1070870 RepID=A0A1M5ENR8_9ACTN|nr:hypothetical protein [Geodermatophilus nigrescens]SHF80672.1 hypothetical protein SAMN05444351_0860 [Geodermatophilus nigrescens]